MPFTITESQLEAILHALAELGVPVEDEDVRREYSGRAMCGTTCFGIVAPGDYALILGVALQRVLGEENPETAERLSHAACTDSMGLSTIFYFPGWTITGD